VLLLLVVAIAIGLLTTVTARTVAAQLLADSTKIDDLQRAIAWDRAIQSSTSGWAWQSFPEQQAILQQRWLRCGGPSSCTRTVHDIGWGWRMAAPSSGTQFALLRHMSGRHSWRR